MTTGDNYIDFLENSINEKYFNYYEISEFINLTKIAIGTYSSLFRAKWKNLDIYCTLKFYKAYCLKELVNEV
jgi:hypothetical protein